MGLWLPGWTAFSPAAGTGGEPRERRYPAPSELASIADEGWSYLHNEALKYA